MRKMFVKNNRFWKINANRFLKRLPKQEFGLKSRQNGESKLLLNLGVRHLPFRHFLVIHLFIFEEA